MRAIGACPLSMRRSALPWPIPFEAAVTTIVRDTGSSLRQS